jgi:hypothetical protein
MLWNAGQKRVGSERKERLTEIYVGTRDGQIAALLATGQAKARGDITPSYVRPEAAAPQSASAYRATLRRLGAMFPGNIREAVH